MSNTKIIKYADVTVRIDFFIMFFFSFIIFTEWFLL